MILDKVAPFYTNEDRAEISRINREIDRVLDEIREARADAENADDPKNDLTLDKLSAIQTWVEEKDKIFLAAEERYIADRADDTKAILADVKDIVDAVEREDYLRYHKRQAEQLEPLMKKKPAKLATEEEKRFYEYVKRQHTRGYESCYSYIKGLIRLQMNALHGERVDIALAMVERKAASLYKKPKKASVPEDSSRRDLNRVLPIMEAMDDPAQMLTIPSGPAIELMLALISQGDVDRFRTSRKKYNRNQIEIKESGDRRQITTKTQSTTVSVEISDFRKIMNQSPNTEKLLTRIMQKANEQALRNGVLTKDTITFPLRDLVGEGQYKSLDTARQGFYNSTALLTDIKVSGTITKGKKNVIKQGSHTVVFTHASVDNATCEITLNEKMNWGLIAPFYNVLPGYYYELPGRASQLLDYIFYLARQNVKQITEEGCFYIGFRAIQHRLALPDENKIRNTKRDIKDEIEKAVEQIEEKYRKYTPNIPLASDGQPAPDFSLYLVADYDAPIKKYLDEGKLQVSLTGEYAKTILQLYSQTKTKVEAAAKRQERIQDEALARNLAKTLEKEKNAEDTKASEKK